MPSGAAPNRGASQPATDGSLTFGASQAPSGASLVEHSGQLTWLEKHSQLTLPPAKGWKNYDTRPWEGRNLHPHLDHADALAAMGLLDARRGAMCDQWSFLLCCACAALQLSGTQPNAKPWKLRRAQLPRLVKHKCQAYCKQSNTNVEDLSQRNVSIRTNW